MQPVRVYFSGCDSAAGGEGGEGEDRGSDGVG